MASHTVRLHPLAADEAEGARAWYLARNPTVADAFLLELDAAIANIAEGPRRWPRIRSRAGIQAAHAERLQLILAALNAAVAPGDMGLPGLKLHPLKGARSGTWAVSVSGNWRVTFRFSAKGAVDVDYEDYH